MHSNANTCSRCRFFSRSACTGRRCYDWRNDRVRRGSQPDGSERDEEERDDDRRGR